MGIAHAIAEEIIKAKAFCFFVTHFKVCSPFVCEIEGLIRGLTMSTLWRRFAIRIFASHLGSMCVLRLHSYRRRFPWLRDLLCDQPNVINLHLETEVV